MANKDTPRTVYWMDNKLYLNITNRCSNNCYFCLKRYKKGVGGFNLTLTEDPSIDKIHASLARF